MAEAVVSMALETFRDILLEEGRFLSGVGNEVKALQTQLEEMKCLLKDADGKQHESESVRNWIKQIQDLAYRAEDAIETYAIKVSAKRGRGLKKLLRRFSCIMNEFHSLHQIGSEISQIKSDLARVSKSMQDYGIRNIIQGETSTTNDNQQWKRQTFPHFKIGDCFVGKDDELKDIVSLLVDEEHRHDRVVSIWGMGGSGKTTIARKAYHHDDTKRFFQGFAWVCISQQCDIRLVLEDVLKQLKNGVTPGLSYRDLIEELCQIQKAKPCIIVLDDLWEIDHWDGLKQAFLVEELKSKILVTTRKQNVAAIGLSKQLGLLSIDSGWELLKMKAFPGTNTPDFACDENLLRKIGEEMVKRCGFLPLAICLLGGVLSQRKSMNEWVLVKENINTFLYRCADNKKENEVEAVLNLSYEDLPHYLKPCFLYLSLFEEDELIYANDIYKIWAAHGMISRGNREHESLDVIAELYLRELASRSIVEFEEYDEDSKTEKLLAKFKLHDVVRELCLLIVEREGFGVQRLYYRGGNSLHDSLLGVKTRHLAIRFQGEDGAKLARHEFAIRGVKDTCNNVRSLLLNDDALEDIEFEKIGIDLQLFKLLRVLHFWELKFGKRNGAKGIGNLIHLRYLCFEDCELDEVPSSIGNLRYLQTLDLSSSWDVRVPNVLNKLLRLKHLMLPSYDDDKVGEYPLKLDEGLDELETLTGFDSSMHQIKSITRLKNLRQFGAKVRDNESLSEVMDALTREWSKLQYCSIVIEKGCELTATDEGLEVLKKVLSCPHLHYLTIQGVKIGKQLNKCGNCVSSSSIVELWLEFCEIEENPMEILGKLPELRILRFWSFVGEEMVCPAFSFPRLKELLLWDLPNLREWRVEEGAMPLLSQLYIDNCPNLMMLPDGFRFISSLKKLTIRETPHLKKRVLVSEDEGGEGGEAVAAGWSNASWIVWSFYLCMNERSSGLKFVWCWN